MENAMSEGDQIKAMGFMFDALEKSMRRPTPKTSKRTDPPKTLPWRMEFDCGWYDIVDANGDYVFNGESTVTRDVLFYVVEAVNAHNHLRVLCHRSDSLLDRIREYVDERECDSDDEVRMRAEILDELDEVRMKIRSALRAVGEE